MGRAMEHDPAVRQLTVWLLLITLTGLSSTAMAKECPLLVVASQSSPVNVLSRKMVRRLFLGVSYQTETGPLKPVRNVSDTMLQEVFLQKILFMSKNTYRHILANRLVRLREAGPAKYRKTDSLIQALNTNPRLISYIWHTQLPRDGHLKTLLKIPCDTD